MYIYIYNIIYYLHSQQNEGIEEGRREDNGRKITGGR
jgi:hypothetical protein